MASTKENAWILDPFTGSSTTGIAANILDRRFLGIDQEAAFLEMSKNRRLQIESLKTKLEYQQKVVNCSESKCSDILQIKEREQYFGVDLPIN